MDKTKEKDGMIGITLVALVVTIVVLLILSGISISILRQTGLFRKANQAEQKSKIVQELENLTLADYENKIDNVNISSTRETIKSQYINSINIDVMADMNKIKIEINTDLKDETKFLCYHYFVKNVDTDEIVEANVSKNSIINVEGLEKNTKYDVLVSVYDIEDNYMKSNVQHITTLDKSPIEITDIAKIYHYNTHGNSMTIKPEGLYEMLFNGNKDEGGEWKGILLNSGYPDTSIKFTVKAKIKLYAYGHYYSDSYGYSGKNVTILKYNEKTNIYENYKTVPTKTDGKRYELLDLDKGKYDLKPAGNYVNFDEWEYELIK